MTTVLTGLGVSSGVAHGLAVPMAGAIPEPPPGAALAPGGGAEAIDAIDKAAAAVATSLQDRAKLAVGQAREILEATAMMAQDPTALALAAQAITERSLVAERAVWEAYESVAEQFAALGGLLAGRVTDLHDVKQRLVAHLTGLPQPGLPTRTEPFILVADDLAPVDTATLDSDTVLAIVTRQGGRTSHTAILARERGIPAVVAVADADQIEAGTELLVDGSQGTVVLAPTSAQVEAGQARAARAAQRVFDGHGRTADDYPVRLLANVGDAAGAVAAAAVGAEGIGLFRTEFCYLDRTEPPSVEEQAQEYRRALEAFEGKSVVFRTLDAGSDKPLPFLDLGVEVNPALGMRGWRIAQSFGQIVEDQLAAIARARDGLNVSVGVMAPLVATVDDADRFVAACARHGLDYAGVMVEVPAAAVLARKILTVAQFASIGTNDLGQYVMAADRLNSTLAPYLDPWQPAVLRTVRFVCKGGRKNRRPIGVCGESAAMPYLAAVLVGLGVSSLSMAASALPDVATALAAVTRKQCRQAARNALASPTALLARLAAEAALPELAEMGI